MCSGSFVSRKWCSEQARELAKIARRLLAKINLIPYNTVEGLEWSRPSRARQETFQSILRKDGVTATLRRENGGTGVSDMAGKAARVAVEPSGSERDTTQATTSPPPAVSCDYRQWSGRDPRHGR